MAGRWRAGPRPLATCDGPPASPEGAQPRDGGRARSVLACVAVRIHGYKGVELAEALSLSSPTVSRIIEKGEFLLDKNKALRVKLKVTQI